MVVDDPQDHDLGEMPGDDAVGEFADESGPREEAVDTKMLRRRSKERWITLGVLLLCTLVGAVFVQLAVPERPDRDFDAARAFGENLRIGNGVVDSGDMSGFESAYDMFTASARDRYPFDEFVGRLDEFEAALGPLEAVKWTGDEGGSFILRTYRFQMTYLGRRGERATRSLSITVKRAETGAYGVEDYEISRGAER